MAYEAKVQKHRELREIQKTTMPDIGEYKVGFVEGKFIINGIFSIEEAEQLRDWLINSLKEAVVKRSDKPKRKAGRPRKQREPNA